MREQGLFRTQLPSHLHRFVDAKVRGMTVAAKCVEDEQLEPFKKCQALGGNLVRIGAVGNVADAEPEHVEPWAMLQPNRRHRGTKQVEGFCRDPVEFQLRGRSRMRCSP